MNITISTTNGPLIYTLLMALAFVLAVAVSLLTCRKFGYGKLDLLFLAVVVAPFGLVGARLFSFLFRLPEAFANPEMFKALLLSGFMYYGGVMGGAIGIAIFCKVRKTSTLATFDMAALILPVAHAVGRVGCLFNGCCYGRPTYGHGLGVIYANGVPNSPVSVQTPLVPVQLYESIFNILLFVVLLVLFLRTNKKGLISGIYLIAYAVWRLIIEFFRIDTRGTLLSLSTSQFISIFIAIPCGILLLLTSFGVFKRKEQTASTN